MFGDRKREKRIATQVRQELAEIESKKLAKEYTESLRFAEVLLVLESIDNRLTNIEELIADQDGRHGDSMQALVTGIVGMAKE